MSENLPNTNRAFQTSARSRKRVVKPKIWLTILLLVLLLLIGGALFMTLRYVLRSRAGAQTGGQAARPAVKRELAFAPSEEGLRQLQAQMLQEGLILPDAAAA